MATLFKKQARARSSLLMCGDSFHDTLRRQKLLSLFCHLVQVSDKPSESRPGTQRTHFAGDETPDQGVGKVPGVSFTDSSSVGSIAKPDLDLSIHPGKWGSEYLPSGLW